MGGLRAAWRARPINVVDQGQTAPPRPAAPSPIRPTTGTEKFLNLPRRRWPHISPRRTLSAAWLGVVAFTRECWRRHGRSDRCLGVAARRGVADGVARGSESCAGLHEVAPGEGEGGLDSD